uniref:VWFA domain-containing protein n=1 Tax=Meloidogyne incognita TaxID=6306 RepID=A0A914KTD2_MELIC
MFSIFGLLLLLYNSLGQHQGVEKALRKLKESVDRFEFNFHKAVLEEYGQIGMVKSALEERAERHFNLLDQTNIDFPAAVIQTEKRIENFFASKVGALKRLASAAEKEALKVNIDEELPISLTDKECSRNLRQLNKNSVKNSQIWERINKGELQQRSGVHVAIEAYKCSGEVVRDLNWTGQQQLERQMIENIKLDSSIMRQYIGTYSGLTRIFPGFKWDYGTEQFGVDLFDPRFRPWFISSESSPRDVLFLLDLSGSAKGMSAHLIKTAVGAVLQTLTPNDFFSGIWYNSRRERVLDNCTGTYDSFVQATSGNKLLFRRLLDRVEERDQASLPAALEMAFDEFFRSSKNKDNNNNTSSPPQRSGGHSIVLLFTDGIEFWPAEVVQKLQKEHPSAEPIRVFGHSVGHGRDAQAAISWLNCWTHAGLSQAVIGSIAEVRMKARDHLKKLNEILALAYRDKAASPENRPITWTPPYMDAQKGGPVLTLSMPLLGNQPNIYNYLDFAKINLTNSSQQNIHLDGFMGIAAIDIAFETIGKILSLEGEFDLTQAYAFIVDNNGLTYFHPRLKTPPAEVFNVRRTLCHRTSTLIRSNVRVPFSRADEFIQQQMGYIDSIPHTDILKLLELDENFDEEEREKEEEDKLLIKFRENLIFGKCSQTLEDDKRQFRCFPIPDTPLIVGFVLRKGRPKIILRGQPEMENPFELSERLKSSFVSNRKNIKQINLQSIIPSSVGLLLRDDQLQQFSMSTELSRFKPLKQFNYLLELLPSTSSIGSLLLSHLSALALNELIPLWSNKLEKKWENVDLCLNENLIKQKQISTTTFIRTFLEFKSTAILGYPGIIAVFPKCKVSSIRSFLHNSFENENGYDNNVIVHFDTEKELITVEQSVGVVDPTRRNSLARIGVQLRSNYLQQKFQLAIKTKTENGWTECSTTNKQHRNCLLLNSDSFVLASNQNSEFIPLHLSQIEPELFNEFLERELIKKITWRNPNSLCPMILETSRLRQQQFSLLQQQNLDNSLYYSSSLLNNYSPFLQFLTFLFSWLDFLIPSFHVFATKTTQTDQFIPLENIECDDEAINSQPKEMLEQCIIEKTKFRIKLKQKGGSTTPFWIREKRCNRTVGLLPFTNSNLYLLIFDGECYNKEKSFSSSIPLFNSNIRGKENLKKN